jgi:LysM repeat protein
MNAAPQHMTHSQAHQWIDQSLDALLDARQQAMLDQHLGGCPACADYLQSHRDLHSQLQRALPTRWTEVAYPPAALNCKLTGLTTHIRRTAMRNTLTSFTRLAAGIVLFVALIFGLASLVHSLNLQPAIPGGDLTATPTVPFTPLPATPTMLPGAMTDLSEGEQLVRAWIFENQPDMNPAAVFPLVEITTPHMRETIEARVFKVTGDIWQNEAFLIWNGRVFKLSTSFGDTGIEHLLVTDLDDNGAPELAYNSHYGSGVSNTIIGLFVFEGQGSLLEARLEDSLMNRLSLTQVDAQTVLVQNSLPGAGASRVWRMALVDGELKLDEQVSDAQTYTVQPGDTCAAIAAAHNLSMEQFIALNGLTSSCLISVGQILILSDDTTRLYNIAEWGLSFQVPANWQAVNGANGAVRLEGPDGYIEQPVVLQTGDLRRACELALNTNLTGIFDGKSSASVIEVASRTICFINKALSNGQENNEAWLYLPVGSQGQFARLIVDHNHLGLVISTLAYHNTAGLPSELDEPVMLANETNPPAPVLTASPMGNLTLEEWRVVSSSVDSPSHFEFNQRIPADVRERRAAWRETSLTARYTHPVFAGPRLISLDVFYGEDDRYHISIRQDDQEIFRYHPVGGGVSEPVKGLWSWDGHWVLEINGVLIVDGAIWNVKDFPADEIFNWHMLNGRPLFFFTRADQTGIWYDGRELPVTYDSVVHYRCCEPYIFNPSGNDQMVWFYAQRAGYWYYVELGKFD